MRIICFLRDAGFSINGISRLLRDNEPEKIISVLIEEQEKILTEELTERQSKLELLEGIKREMRDIESFSVDSIGDIKKVIDRKKSLSKMRAFMIVTGVPVSILEWVAIIAWIVSGAWWLFVGYVVVAALWAASVMAYYFGHVAYICPECHAEFRPKIREAFFAYHTPKMRKLTCPSCGRVGLCVEVYKEKEKR